MDDARDLIRAFAPLVKDDAQVEAYSWEHRRDLHNLVRVILRRFENAIVYIAGVPHGQSVYGGVVREVAQLLLSLDQLARFQGTAALYEDDNKGDDDDDGDYGSGDEGDDEDKGKLKDITPRLKHID